MADRMTFVPGGEPGKYAGGFVNDKYLVELQTRRLKMSNYPVGDRTAKVFPWLRTSTVHLHALEERIVKNQWASTFLNSGAFNVFIDEVRFYAGSDRPVNPGASFQMDINVKMSIAHRKQIVERWLPWSALNTETDRYYVAFDDSLTWKFPSPYFLSRTQVFMMDVLSEAWLISDTPNADPAFYMHLYGFGAADGEPIQLVKPVFRVLRANIGALTTNHFQTIPFDDDRDQPLRDAWITHVGFGGHTITNEARQLQHTRIRPVPPEGPKWHDGDFFRICQLSEQVGFSMNAGGTLYVPDCVIHRPVGPYVLKPGEEFVVELRHRDRNLAGNAFDIDVNLTGTQEGAL